MEIKHIELRDRATLIPVLCLKRDGNQAIEEWMWEMAGNGYPPLVIPLDQTLGGRFTSDPYDWQSWGIGARTLFEFHKWLSREGSWESIKDGDVVDVEYIVGEKSKPTTSYRPRSGLWYDVLQRLNLIYRNQDREDTDE